MIYTDRERLAWVFDNSPKFSFELKNERNKMYCLQYSCKITNKEKLFQGDNYHECIDQALNAEKNSDINKLYENTYILNIGDWDEDDYDGHGYCMNIAVNTNKLLFEIQEAYKKSCLTSGIYFDRVEKNEKDKIPFFSDFNETTLEQNHKDLFSAFGINVLEYVNDNEEFESIEMFAKLILEFIKKSLPNFNYEFLNLPKEKLEELESINGNNNANLNVFFGYSFYELGLLGYDERYNIKK